MSLNPNSNDDLLKTLGVERDRDTYKINSAYHITLVLKNLTDKIDELRKSQSTISEQPKKSEISKNIDELRKASLDILFTEYEKQYDKFDASSESKKIDPKAIAALSKSNQEVLKDHIEYCEKNGLKPNQYLLLNSNVIKKLAQDYVDAHNQILAASKKLSRAEFEEALISGHDEHSKKNDFDTSSNLPLNAVIIGHSDYIKKLQLNKEDGASNKFDSCSSRTSHALSNSEFEKVYTSIKSLPHKQDQDIYNKLEESLRDFSSSIMSGLRFNKKPDSSIKSTPPIPFINHFSVTLDSIVKSFSKTGNGNGLFENINGNPMTLASEGHSFQIPQPWLTGSKSLQSWFSSTTTSLFTSFPKSAEQNQEPNKQEPDSGYDPNLQQKIIQSVKKNLVQRRSTPPPHQKPPSPEAAKEAKKATPVPMRKASSALAGPARDATPPAQIRRTSSDPAATREINKKLEIEFFGIGTKRHREHPKSTHPDAEQRRRRKQPDANGPRGSTASTLHPSPNKRTRR